MANIKENTMIEEDVNYEKKVTVRSIAGWTTGFKRIETIGDVTIPPEGSVRLPRSEIIAQIQTGNRLFTGIDGVGSHATLYIEDEITRQEVDFENKESKVIQQVLTIDIIKKMLEYKTMKTFEEKLKESVVTDAEKYYIMKTIQRLKFNEYDKISVVENHARTGIKIA